MLSKVISNSEGWVAGGKFKGFGVRNGGCARRAGLAVVTVATGFSESKGNLRGGSGSEERALPAPQGVPQHLQEGLVGPRAWAVVSCLPGTPRQL